MDITKSSRYRDFVWGIKGHDFTFKVIGLWPKTDKVTKKILCPEIWIGIIVIFLLYISILMIIMVIHVWGNMIRVIDSLHITLPIFITLVKYIIMQWKRTVFFTILNMMEEDWIAFRQFEEKSMMVRRARNARLIMMIGYVMAVLGFLTAVIPPCFGIQTLYTTNFMNRSKLLPLETYDFYDTNKSPQYELTFFIQIITILLAAIIYISVDFFLVVIVLHIYGQLEIFKCRLVSLVLCKNFKKVLRNIIATHIRLIRFAENIEDVYSLLMLIMVLYFVVTFCLQGFLFAVIKSSIPNMLVLIILLMNTFLYCGAGEIIKEQCSAVYRALCDLEWYKLEPKEARNLILVMVRTHHPFHITAGKIIPLTLATFCSVLKTSCGYISFLMTRQN